ncbi:VanZ family protein [Sporofaciens sp. SGI.106]|uniref:VanZ family protein n=1 Tax=Sporofaciens sp. SGI.106 TaxID=3420568 RepID=UPI003CFC2510
MDFTGTLLNEYNSLPAYWWLWLIVVALVVWLIDGRRVTPRPLLAAYILFILMETIIGRKTGVGRVELVPFWSYSHPELSIEILLNYVLFIPLGVLLYLCFGEKLGLRVFIAGFLLSALIELIQLTFKIGVFEFDDMIGNTIGCLIGAVVGKLIRKKKKKTTPEAV